MLKHTLIFSRRDQPLGILSSARTLQTQKHRQIRRLGNPNPMEDVPDQDSAKSRYDTTINSNLLTRAILGQSTCNKAIWVRFVSEGLPGRSDLPGFGFTGSYDQLVGFIRFCRFKICLLRAVNQFERFIRFGSAGLCGSVGQGFCARFVYSSVGSGVEKGLKELAKFSS